MLTRTKVLALAGTVITALSASPVLADSIVAGDPALSPYTLQYGDFNVVSLAFANTGTNTNNYYVASGPGQIRNDIVVGTGAGGSFYNGTPGGSMSLAGSDAPYVTESGEGTSSYFATGNSVSAPDPGGAGEFAGDTAHSWDIQTSVLKNYLGGQNAVFYFNLNENGVADQLSGTDLLFWMAVTASGSGVPTQTFYLAGNPFDPNGSGYGAAQSALNGAPDATAPYPNVPSGSTYDPTDARWTYVHGDICVNGSTFLHYGSCVNTDVAGAKTVNQDLGANQAAFAGYSLALDALINNPDYTTLQVSWEMAAEDNGYEQLFILPGGGGSVTTQVAEPLTLSLFGAGLVGAAVLRRRKRLKA